MFNTLSIKKQNSNSNAFTIIELLVVIAIIGLLSSVVLVSMKGSTGKAKIAKGLEFSQTLMNTIGVDAVGVWTFDEGSGGTAHDKSGYGNHGTITGATWVSGEENTPHWFVNEGDGRSALSFDGNDYIDIGRPSSLQIGGSMTIEYWVKPTAIASGRQNPICKHYVDSGCITHEAGGSISFYSGNGSTYLYYYLQANMKDNVWHHIVFTRDEPNQTVKGYVNGKWDNSTVNRWTPTVAGNSSWRIGRGYVNDFRGLIDEVRIYERALSSSEIQQHYADGVEKHGLALK